MSTSDVERLSAAIQKRWPSEAGDKANRYVGKFFGGTRLGTKISAQVDGNHGTYTVSMYVEGEHLNSACSCYIGKHGYCHHCHALGVTFLQEPTRFEALKQRTLEEVEALADLPEYLRSVTLDELVQRLKKQGISQKALAESMGMSSQKLSAIKSSERRNRYFHELGATKLACLWVLEHFTKE